MKRNLDARTAVKLGLTIALVIVAAFSHSVFYTFFPLLVAAALWLRRRPPFRWVAAVCLAALLAGIIISAPRRHIDPERRLNLLVDDGDSIAQPSFACWLRNVVIPENELAWFHGVPVTRQREEVMSGYVLQCFDGKRPVYVRQPLHVNRLTDYHVVLMPQGAHGNLLGGQRAAEWLDSCIVVTLGTSDTTGRYTGDDLAAFTLRVLPALRRMGYRIDRRYVSLVDNSADGSLAAVASRAPGDVFRNIIRWNAPADTLLPRSSARQVMVGKRREYARNYATWRDAGINVDHFTVPESGQRSTITEVLNGRLGVPMSRLERAQELAKRLNYEEQFVMFADYTIPSGKNRFFVYDYVRQRIVVRSKCTHGCGPGNTEPVPVFSNEIGSACSSLGNFAVHGVHPMAKNGRISIYLDGLDPTNSNARLRGVVMHSGMRMEGEIYPRYLKLGRLSEGCVSLSNIPFAMVCGIVNSCDRPVLLQSYYK